MGEVPGEAEATSVTYTISRDIEITFVTSGLHPALSVDGASLNCTEDWNDASWEVLEEGCKQFHNKTFKLTGIPSDLLGMKYCRGPCHSGHATLTLTSEAPIIALISKGNGKNRPEVSLPVTESKDDSMCTGSFDKKGFVRLWAKGTPMSMHCECRFAVADEKGDFSGDGWSSWQSFDASLDALRGWKTKILQQKLDRRPSKDYADGFKEGPSVRIHARELHGSFNFHDETHNIFDAIQVFQDMRDTPHVKGLSEDHHDHEEDDHPDVDHQAMDAPELCLTGIWAGAITFVDGRRLACKNRRPVYKEKYRGVGLISQKNYEACRLCRHQAKCFEWTLSESGVIRNAYLGRRLVADEKGDVQLAGWEHNYVENATWAIDDTGIVALVDGRRLFVDSNDQIKVAHDLQPPYSQHIWNGPPTNTAAMAELKVARASKHQQLQEQYASQLKTAKDAHELEVMTILTSRCPEKKFPVQGADREELTSQISLIEDFVMPGADLFPGCPDAQPSEEPAIVKSGAAQKVNWVYANYPSGVTYHGPNGGRVPWTNTHLYAPPGGKIIVSTMEGADFGDWVLQVGCHTNRERAWYTVGLHQRWPTITRDVDLPDVGSAVEFTHKFGGLLFLKPRSDSMPGNELAQSVTVKISGCVAAPHIVVKDSVCSCTDGPAPWGEVEGEYVSFILHKEDMMYLKSIIKPAVIWWDACMKALYDFHGGVWQGIPMGERKERFVADIEDNYEVRGYPLHLGYGDIRVMFLKGAPDTSVPHSAPAGVLHVIGHHLGRLDWLMPGQSESSCNMFRAFVSCHFFNKQPEKTCLGNDWLDVVQTFGWDCMKRVFSSYAIKPGKVRTSGSIYNDFRSFRNATDLAMRFAYESKTDSLPLFKRHDWHLDEDQVDAALLAAQKGSKSLEAETTWLWIVTASGTAYNCALGARGWSKIWTRIPNEGVKLVQVSSTPHYAWALDDKHHLYQLASQGPDRLHKGRAYPVYKTFDHGTSWSKVDAAALVHIDANSCSVWGISDAGAIYCRPVDDVSGSWTVVKQVGVDDGRKLLQVSATPYWVWAVDDAKNIYRLDAPFTGKWMKVDNANQVAQIDCNSARVWGRSEDGHTYYRLADGSGSWTAFHVSVPPPMDYHGSTLISPRSRVPNMDYQYSRGVLHGRPWQVSGTAHQLAALVKEEREVTVATYTMSHDMELTFVTSGLHPTLSVDGIPMGERIQDNTDEWHYGSEHAWHPAKWLVLEDGCFQFHNRDSKLTGIPSDLLGMKYCRGPCHSHEVTLTVTSEAPVIVLLSKGNGNTRPEVSLPVTESVDDSMCTGSFEAKGFVRLTTEVGATERPLTLWVNQDWTQTNSWRDCQDWARHGVPESVTHLHMSSI